MKFGRNQVIYDLVIVSKKGDIQNAADIKTRHLFSGQKIITRISVKIIV